MSVQEMVVSSVYNKSSMVGITQPVPFNPEIRRYYPHKDFPSYRYVPRLTPHPVKDPDGHSYRTTSEDIICSVYDASNWPENADYLYGVDLFNFAYWWEAHEAWEEGWASTTGTQKLFLQGMIQISASLIKWNVKQFRGMRSLSISGREKLQKVSIETANFMGIDISQFMKRLDSFFSLSHEDNITISDVLDISAEPLIFLNCEEVNCVGKMDV